MMGALPVSSSGTTSGNTLAKGEIEFLFLEVIQWLLGFVLIANIKSD
jgi:hypothetical protein